MALTIVGWMDDGTPVYGFNEDTPIDDKVYVFQSDQQFRDAKWIVVSFED